mgnify:CR=1 FL=1
MNGEATIPYQPESAAFEWLTQHYPEVAKQVGYISVYSNDIVPTVIDAIESESDLMVFLSYIYVADPYLPTQLHTDAYRKEVLGFLETQFDKQELAKVHKSHPQYFHVDPQGVRHSFGRDYLLN